MDHFPILSSSQKAWPDFPALTLEDYDADQLPYIVHPKDDTQYRLSEKDFDDFPFFWLEDQRLHIGLGTKEWDDRLLDPNETLSPLVEKLKLKLKSKPRASKEERCRSIDEDRLWSPSKQVYDFSNYLDLEAAIFVQNKYYFGAINEVLAFDQPMPTSEFVVERAEGEWVLCTAKLNDYISRWAGYLNSLEESERFQRLREAKAFLEHMVRRRWHKDRHHLLRVSASVQILARTIQAAMTWYWDILPVSNERLSDHIKCLEMSGWCKSMAPKSSPFLSPLTPYSASVIDSHLDRHYSHKNCSGKICETFTIEDESTYRTKHTPECDGTCGDVQIDSEMLHNLIMQGKIPIVSLSMGTDGKLNTEVTHAGDVPHYIAISHVWSDGLGNPHGNALPYCELLKMFRMLEEWPLKHAKPDWMNSFLSSMDMIQRRMESDGVDPSLPQQVRDMRDVIEPMAEEHVNNWIDTLKTSGQYQKVNLWMDTICIPHIRESRKIAITQINDVYSGSFYTVALDAGLESLPDTASSTEIFLRLELSSWKGRCWTFLERERSTYHLRVKVGDRLVDIVETFNFDELNGLYQSSSFGIAKLRCFNNWCKLNGILKEKGFRGLNPMQLFNSPGGIKTDKLLDLYGDFMRITTSEQMKESMATWSTTPHGQYHESFSLLKCIKQRIAETFFRTYMGFLNEDSSMITTWNDLAARSTTRASDRLIIFVSSLDIASNSGILKEVVQLKKEERMEAWIRKQRAVPVDFLFLKSPHLLTPGLRWAPNDVYPKNLGREVASRSLDELELRITRPGILLTLDMALNLNTVPHESDENLSSGEGKQSPWDMMTITNGEIKYCVRRILDPGQPSKPTLKFAKGEKIGLIFRYSLGPNDISNAAIVHVHDESPDEIRSTFHDVASVLLDGELSPEDPREDPSKRSKLGRFLGGRSSTNEEMNCFWNFELVEKQWVVG
ncbi:hypothetical protein V494_06803 [Pseudogymnoascus sp. VKM F-4513 (FW-928)]|nr:hypothetical protein V494_06803 [Pseudogymnoascus sp. VKM F-4513 (FW-928)]